MLPSLRYTADPIPALSGSCNGESCGVSLLSVACVSHELHAQKIHGPRCHNYYEQTGSELSTALVSSACSSLTSRVPPHYTLLVKPIHGLFGLLSRGEAIRDKSAQYISMQARVASRVVPNMESLP